jgi:hypothetical protein
MRLIAENCPESTHVNSRNNPLLVQPWTHRSLRKIKDRYLIGLHCGCEAKQASEMNPVQLISTSGIWPVAVSPAEALGSSHSRLTSNRASILHAKIRRTASELEVWVYRRRQRVFFACSIGSALANDALQHSQDLVDHLLNNTLKQLERGCHLPTCALARWRSKRRPGSLSSVPADDLSSIPTRSVVDKRISTLLDMR